jgi:hypothetical protein
MVFCYFSALGVLQQKKKDKPALRDKRHRAPTHKVAAAAHGAKVKQRAKDFKARVIVEHQQKATKETPATTTTTTITISSESTFGSKRRSRKMAHVHHMTNTACDPCANRFLVCARKKLRHMVDL